MIRIENLTKIFRTEEVETTALNGVSLQVKDGEFVAVMGPSGCGKSTLLSILGLLDNPTDGKYYLDDEEVGHLKEKERTRYRKGRIGFVFQSFNLIDELTVEENVELQLKYLGVPKEERKERVLDILRKVNLSQRAKHYPQQISGGQQQRVAIARAVVGKPKLILADEPTGNLDSKNGLEVMELLSQLNAEGTTIVMVTHSQHDAAFAQRIVNLFAGNQLIHDFVVSCCDVLHNAIGGNVVTRRHVSRLNEHVGESAQCRNHYHHLFFLALNNVLDISQSIYCSNRSATKFKYLHECKAIFICRVKLVHFLDIKVKNLVQIAIID